jgi:iron complex outermembrane receptor protein
MKAQMNTLFRTALLASAASASLLAVPTLAQAQTAAASGSSQAGVEVGEIVVTGSRIRRANLTSVQPLQVITTERIEKRGFTNVADSLNELPSSGVPVNPIGDQGGFGTGRNFVNIFSLGTNRTLTLVNGRRFVGGNPASIFTGAGAGGQVDLNVIPTGLIDRIETIQAGGSAVYGSDAIAGVVNIITRTEYDGFEVDGQFGISDENDAEVYRGRIIAGKSFFDDRLSLFGSYEYNETSALAFTDRAVTNRQIAFASNPANTSTSDGIPGAILITDRRIPETTFGGIPFRSGGSALSGLLTIVDPANPASRVNAQFGPGGALIPYNSGTFFQPSIVSGGDGMNLALLSSLQSPVKRHVANGFVKFDITDNIRFTSELLYARADAVEPFNQPIYNAPIFGGNSASLRMSTSNPFLPAASRAALLSQPTPLPTDPLNAAERIFFLSRASVDIGNNKTDASGETQRGVFAFEGDLNFLDRNFNWDVSANFGESTGYFRTPNIDQSKFLLAIDAVRDASGAVVCASAVARAAGCAPLNLFGEGAPSKAALDYVSVQFRSDFKIQQAVYQGNFGGELLTVPAGKLTFNVGYEYRREKSDFNPNDPQERGIGRSAAITGLQGKFDTKEYYGEAELPVFGGDFKFLGMESLTLEGQYRKVDHSLAGKDESWQVGGRWYPVADLMIRANKGQSFRAPAVTELFLPDATSFVTATDPCDARNITGGPNPTARAANCRAAFQAAGLPANFTLTSQVQASTVQGTTSGNRSLRNEVADQWSIGFVYQPSWIEGLAISFDWTDIALKKAIFNFNLNSILQVCYDSPDAQPDACGRFQRGTSSLLAARQGQILTNGEAVGNGQTATGPRQGFINAGYVNFEGFTAGIDYRVDLETALGGAFKNWLGGTPGTLDFNYDLYNIDTLQTSVTGLGFDLNRDEAEIGQATWQWKLETNYSRNNLEAIWTVNYVGESAFNNDFTIETRRPLKVDDYFLHDLALVYDLSDFSKQMGLNVDRLRARVVVKNVFDDEPPYGTTGLGTYDVIGRYFQVGLTARF